MNRRMNIIASCVPPFGDFRRRAGRGDAFSSGTRSEGFGLGGEAGGRTDVEPAVGVYRYASTIFLKPARLAICCRAFRFLKISRTSKGNRTSSWRRPTRKFEI